MVNDDNVREQALDWAVRAGDPGFADWEAFMLWLEADPAHSRAYDEINVALHDGADLLASAPANDDEAVASRPWTATRRTWLGGAVAASLALVGTLWLFQGGQRDLYTVRTADGQTRTVMLHGSARVDIAGGTIIAFDRKDGRFASLAQGQALFSVRHDEAQPFEVLVDGKRLVDIGTVFDVRRDLDGAMSVAVAEGAVQFDPDDADVRVSPGEILQRRPGVSGYTLSELPAERVGEWREGRLTFEAETLEVVAARLTRATGINYAATPGASSDVISGSILVAPLRQDPAAIGPLLGVPVRLQDGRWMIGQS